MTSALNWYLQINLLLAASYVVFRLCLLGLSRLKHQPNFTSATRIAQALVLAGALIPLALALAPPKKLPRVHLTQIQPLSDGMGVALRTEVGRRIQAALPYFVSTGDGQRLAFTTLFANAERLLLGTLVLLIVAGIGLMSWRLARDVGRLNRLISEAVVVRRIGRVLVLVSDSISVPMSTLATFHAVIVLPPQIVANATDLRIAIRHELQHHRQRDTAWAIWIELLVILCFANPAIYLWKRQIIELQEFACDEALIGRKGVRSEDYGGCLLRAAEAALRHHPTLLGTACMATGAKNARYFKSFLRRRVEMFTEYGVSTRTKAAAITLGTLSLLAVAAVAYGAQQVLRPNSLTGPNPGRAAFDTNIQGIAERALQAAVDADGAEAGFVLVSEPATGRLLAATNVSKDPERRGRSWALSYLLEPGSAMKALAAAAAVNQRATSFDEQFDCENGQYSIGVGVVVRDWKPFVSLSTTETVVNSSNICGIKIGERLGVAGLARMLSDFGFGVGGTSEGFPEAAPGELPRPTQLTDEEYVTLVASGFAPQPLLRVTPLEMVQAFGAIANGGKLMKAIAASDLDSSVSVVRQVIDPRTAEGMKAVLAKVVTDGTGKLARSALFTTAGKTSTTNGTTGDDGGERVIAGFVGFAPVEMPRVVIYVGIIDPPKINHPTGGQQAAPVFRQVAEQVLLSMHISPDNH
jgi:beta-lactamase regulating signal transducer with metallopeptidase domain